MWGGCVLHLFGSPFSKIKVGLGEGTNNLTKLLSLKLSLLFSLEKGSKNIQIFGNSMLVLNYVKEVQQFHNVVLDALLGETK